MMSNLALAQDKRSRGAKSRIRHPTTGALDLMNRAATAKARELSLVTVLNLYEADESGRFFDSFSIARDKSSPRAFRSTEISDRRDGLVSLRPIHCSPPVLAGPTTRAVSSLAQLGMSRLRSPSTRALGLVEMVALLAESG
jgi:hypothetical protein